jgi:hypothetical protein
MPDGAVIMDDAGGGRGNNKSPKGPMTIRKEVPSGTIQAMDELKDPQKLTHKISSVGLDDVEVALGGNKSFTISSPRDVVVISDDGSEFHFEVTGSRDIFVTASEALNDQSVKHKYETGSKRNIAELQVDGVDITFTGNDKLTVTVNFS